MLSYLSDLENIFGPARLFKYITFRAAMAGFTAMVFGFACAPWLFNRLRFLKMAQTIRDASQVGALADLHAGKKNTPTMGGLLVYLAVMLSSFIWAKLNVYVVTAWIVYTGLTVIGFADDYLKVTKKNTKGVPSWIKLAAQGAITLIALAILLGSTDSHHLMSELWLPFMKCPLMVEMPLLLSVVLFFFVMAGSSNAINLTDGVDGLAIGCTISVALAYAIMAYAIGNKVIADYLWMHVIPGAGELTIICAALVGASLVFLWYNAYPAEVFMGDTGSLGIGGLIGAIAFMVHQPFTLIIVGGIFVMEAVSVILQILSFKLTGKRIFRMAPLHHHFELLHWHESKVVIRFWILSLVFALIGLSTLKLR